MNDLLKKINAFGSTASTAESVGRIVSWIIVFASGGFTFVSSIPAELTDVYGLGWAIFAGAMVSFIVALTMFLIQLATFKAAQNDQLKLFSRTSDQVNPLDTEFNNKIIYLTDLALPLATMQRHGRKTFRNCHIVGPGIMPLARGAMLKHCKFSGTSVIPVSDPVTMSCLVFEACEFIDCTFVEVQFMAIDFPDSQLQAFRDMGTHIAGEQENAKPVNTPPVPKPRPGPRTK